MELLVRVVDKHNPTSIEKDAALSKRGDVIVAVEDGHNWGTEELSNPEWRIIKVPGAPEELVNNLLKQEDAASNRQFRERYIELDGTGISPNTKNYINDDSRAVAFIEDADIVFETQVRETRQFETEEQFAIKKSSWPSKGV